MPANPNSVYQLLDEEYNKAKEAYRKELNERRALWESLPQEIRDEYNEHTEKAKHHAADMDRILMTKRMLRRINVRAD